MPFFIKTPQKVNAELRGLIDITRDLIDTVRGLLDTMKDPLVVKFMFGRLTKLMQKIIECK